MNKFKIVLLCVFAAITYGVLHDQVTARICLEYFTVAHPPLFRTTSPTLLAICWGVTATVGIGTILGLVLAFVAESGDEPAVPFARLRRLVGGLLVIMAVGAFVAGALGYLLAMRGVISIPAALAEAIPPQNHQRFMSVWSAHAASYIVGLAGGAHLVFRTWRERGRPFLVPLFPRSPTAIFRAVVICTIAAYVLWTRFKSF